jgi:hypothetical protein
MLKLAIIRENERDGDIKVMLVEEFVEPVLASLQGRFHRKGKAAEAALAAMYDIEQKLRDRTHSLT